MHKARTIVGERYRLERKVGSGGMGTVWLAQDLLLDSRCAVKLVDVEKARDPEVRMRFQREAKAAAKIRCDNVVDVFDHGEWNGGLYIAMEFLDGEDLYSRLYHVGRLEPQETYEILVQVARALTRAHAAGIVHRDIKPENVFLVPGDDHEVAKVLDFGIAKHDAYQIGDSGTKAGMLLGTPYYMSPEQVRGQVVDWRADLWSLGVIAFFCLTGRPPFDSEALGQLMGSILYERIPMLTDANPSLSPELDRWWTKASARAREERFQSAKQLVDAFGEAIGCSRLPVPSLPPREPALSDAGLEEASGSPPTAVPDQVAQADTARADASVSTARAIAAFSEVEPPTGPPVARTRSLLSYFGQNHHRRRFAVGGALVLIGLGVVVLLAQRSRPESTAASLSDEQPLHPAAGVAVVTPQQREVRFSPRTPTPVPAVSSWTQLPLVSPSGPNRPDSIRIVPRSSAPPVAPKAKVPDYGI